MANVNYRIRMGLVEQLEAIRDVTHGGLLESFLRSRFDDLESAKRRIRGE